MTSFEHVSWDEDLNEGKSGVVVEPLNLQGVKEEEEKPQRARDPGVSRLSVDDEDDKDLDELGVRLLEEEESEEEVVGSKPYNPFEVWILTPVCAKENHFTVLWKMLDTLTS